MPNCKYASLLANGELARDIEPAACAIHHSGRDLKDRRRDHCVVPGKHAARYRQQCIIHGRTTRHLIVRNWLPIRPEQKQKFRFDAKSQLFRRLATSLGELAPRTSFRRHWNPKYRPTLPRLRLITQ
jgi:hypothetical protein